MRLKLIVSSCWWGAWSLSRDLRVVDGESLRELAPPVGMRQVTRFDVAQDGATPLYMAAQKSHEGCAKLLLEAKAAVDAATNVSGRCAATVAVWRVWEG